MIELFDEYIFNNSKSNDKLELKCEFCSSVFLLEKKFIKKYKTKKLNLGRFCNQKCWHEYNSTKTKLNCIECNLEFYRILGHIKKSKNHFCSQSCAAFYNAKHKTTGNRRSKLEIWIESKLTELYPDLYIDYNKTTTINSELDIYIPSIKLAIELNGIFHYEPIFGNKKLEQIQNNDHRKHQACYEQGIEILSIDTSSFKHFKEHNAQKYLDIITNIIEQKLSTS